MSWGRKKCVIKGTTPQKVMPHDEFMQRIRKTFYFGGDTFEEDMQVCSRPLAEYASELFSEPHRGHSLHRLNRNTAGAVHATPCSLIMSLIYLDRLNMTDPNYVRRITPQELFIVSMMISTKLYAGHDEDIYTSDWAEDGDMSEDRLKQLELEFLSAINWNIYISNEQFFNKLTCIEETLARREGLRRGWLTYTELVRLLPNYTLLKFIFNSLTVIALSYAAGVMAIAGAFFLVSQMPVSSLHRTPQTEPLSKVCTVSTAPDNAIHIMPHALDATRKRDARTANRSSMTQAHTDTALEQQNANADERLLNVEAELQHLEQEYREEALNEQLRRRQNELDGMTKWSSTGGQQTATQTQRTLPQDMHRNWLSLMEEYSDVTDNLRMDTWYKDSTVHYAPEQPNDPWYNFWQKDHLQRTFTGNGTAPVFWQMLASFAEQSLVRLPPFIWFKLI